VRVVPCPKVRRSGEVQISPDGCTLCAVASGHSSCLSIWTFKSITPFVSIDMEGYIYLFISISISISIYIYRYRYAILPRKWPWPDMALRVLERAIKSSYKKRCRFERGQSRMCSNFWGYVMPLTIERRDEISMHVYIDRSISISISISIYLYRYLIYIDSRIYTYQLGRNMRFQSPQDKRTNNTMQAWD
jgi:hypothetical protein